MTIRTWSITCLVDDHWSGVGLPTEHGLCLLVEADGVRGLLDTGATALVADNAARLGVDLARIAWVVLSHGHYDHTGGLEAVLAAAPTAAVHAHPDALGVKGVDGEHAAYEIGCRVPVRELATDLCLARGPRGVAPGVLCTGEIPLATRFEEPEPRFWVEDASGRHQDTFADDQALVLDTEDGLVVLLGCAHRGVVNTLRHVTTLLPGRPLHLVLGGMHLYAASDARIEQTLDALQELGVEQVGCCHCTGDVATSIFRDRFGSRYLELGAGVAVASSRSDVPAEVERTC